MDIDFGSTFGVITDTKATLDKLKDKASLGQGVVLVVIATIVMMAVLAVIMGAVFSSIANMPGVNMPSNAGTMMMFSSLPILAAQIILGIVLFIVNSWIIANLTKSISSGAGDFERTAGLLAYVSFSFSMYLILPIFIIVGLLAIFVSPIAMMAMLVVIGIALWELICEVRAIQAANKVNGWSAFAALVISTIIVGVISMLVSMAIMGPAMMSAYGV